MEINAYEREHIERLRKLLPECTVLLKSDGTFPLDGPCRLALYGNGARHTVKGGTGSGEVNSRYFVNAEQGLREAGFEITTGEWLDAYDAVLEQAAADFVSDIKRRARRKRVLAVVEGMGAVMPEPEYDIPLHLDGEAAVYVLARISGEGNDRKYCAGDILLTDSEIRDILYLQQHYRRFMLVLNTGGPVDLTPVEEVDNVLLLSQLGVETGAVLADILLGRSEPSGRLTTTWAAAGEYPKFIDFGAPDDTRYRESIYVGYRYFDSVGKKAMFPFGHGLSYTSFETVPAGISAEGARVDVRATVKNTGGRRGREVLQLYVSVPEGKLDQPYQTLAAFAKTVELEPGQEEEVTLSFRMTDIAGYDTENASYILEKGDYILRLGVSSADTKAIGAVSIDSDTVVRKVRNIGGRPDFSDWRPDTRRTGETPEGLERIAVPAGELRLESPEYDTEDDILPETLGYSDEVLALMNTGGFDPKGGVLNVVGDASRSVAGAAGETAGALRDKGIGTLVMADGPAGIRLSRDYIKDKKGVRAVGASLPGTMAQFMPKPLMMLMSLMGPKIKKGTQVLHHYATAIPIGTALAQSWNRDAAYICGDIVGAEMELMGVHLWLAPALNIHRDIRCGRNFEYFSEDPLISGSFAAALTRGVQEHRGCGTTIKHFAANNQETNRYNSNSILSERTLREIYLRGFAICVREAQPCAVMTSYNLINGRHTSEMRDLTEDYLRAECGFLGIVMTDWLVAMMQTSGANGYPAARASEIAAAGGDLIMPGCRQDVDGILAALADGTLSRDQVRANVSRTVRMVRRLTDK